MRGKRKLLLLVMTTASLAMGIRFFNNSSSESFKPGNPLMKLSDKVFHSNKDTNNTGALLSNTFDTKHGLQALPNETVSAAAIESSSSEATSNYLDEIAKFFEMDVQRDTPNILLNEHRFDFTLNTKACQGNELLVTLVFTAVDHFDSRSRIRNTWGSVKGNATLVAGPIFLIGQISPTTDNLQVQIEQESVKYGDIVQGNFDDSYRNLTYKTIMGLHWVRHFCNQTKFMLKVDDDVLVNMDKLLDHLKAMKGIDTNLIWCNPNLKARPVRSASKFKVTLEEYPLKIFPPYCSGWFYVMSNDVSAKLYDASKTVKYFWIEDVLVTGALTLKAGIRIKPCPFGTFLIKPSNVIAFHMVFYLAEPIQLLKNWYPTWDKIGLINNQTIMPHKMAST